MITVPDRFVADLYEDKSSERTLTIKNADILSLSTIRFYNYDKNFLFEEETLKKIHREKDKLLGNSKCEKLSDHCFWFSSMKKIAEEDSPISISYEDFVYFNKDSIPFLIFFSGHDSDRQYFLEMIESIKAAPFASSDWQNEYPVNQPDRFISSVTSLLRYVFPDEQKP